ncbi:hypothetical protein [Okeania sp. KiyG1]|nr:hypothetical protein [Okeania sp. KiyG1]
MDNQNLQICLEPRSLYICNSSLPELEFMAKALMKNLSFLGSA